MRKRLLQAMVITALLSLFCIAASAADPTQAGIYDVNNKQPGVIEYQVDGTNVGAVTIGNDSYEAFYQGAEKITITYSNATSGQYLVIASQGVPTEKTIEYIDQNGTGAFVVFPNKLKSGTYSIYLTSNGNDSFGVASGSEILTFQYYEPYKRGDANGDKEVDPKDAVMILQYYVKMPDAMSKINEAAAKVNDDDEIDPKDAVMVLQYYVKILDENFKPKS